MLLLTYLKKQDFPSLSEAYTEYYADPKNSRTNMAGLPAFENMRKAFPSVEGNTTHGITLNVLKRDMGRYKNISPTFRKFLGLLLKYVVSYSKNTNAALIGNVTRLREVIYNHMPNHRPEVLKLFNVSEQEAARNIKYQADLKNKRLNQQTISRSTIDHVLTDIKTKIDAGQLDWRGASIGLGLAIGLRSSETFSPAAVAISPSKRGPGYAIVRGSIKKGPAYLASGKNAPVVDLPILEPIQYADLVKMRDIINTHMEKWKAKTTQPDTPETYNGTFSPIIGKIIKKLFNRVDISSQTLREIYANMSYMRYSRPNMDRSAWITNVLRHENPKTALSYQTINIVGDTGRHITEDITRARRDGLQSKFERLDVVAAKLNAQGKPLTYNNIKKSIKVGNDVISAWKKMNQQ